ncbi:hypothetical protein [Microbacterium sp. 77mftsu3.1]|uniref:hypothetical protein n=1 Tax=Microbacterium sp. 77mftsu3.1 TaxID=1761802 RepID=UPI00115FF196|nr:hypothetical protein [Microbacterium sp. 77mftsu3.1]
MTDINAADAAARENHRDRTNGQFGKQDQSAPEVALADREIQWGDGKPLVMASTADTLTPVIAHNQPHSTPGEDADEWRYATDDEYARYEDYWHAVNDQEDGIVTPEQLDLLAAVAAERSAQAAAGTGELLSFEPGQPIKASITHREYRDNNDDEGIIVGTQEVDIAGVLDALPLETLEFIGIDPWADKDHIVQTLQPQGALIHGEMPFDALDIDQGDLEAYIDYRKLNGLTEPVAAQPAPSVKNLLAVAAARKSEADSLREQAAALDAEREEAEEGVIRAIVGDAVPGAVRVTVQHDHHKYPLEFWDADGQYIIVGEQLEKQLVKNITDTLGPESGVLGGRGTAHIVELSA